MRNRKWLATAVLSLCGMIGCTGMMHAVPAYAAEQPPLQMIINDVLYAPSAEQVGPELIDDRVYVPLRLVSESLQHQVQWLEQSRTVCIFTDENASLLPDNAYPTVAEDAPIVVYIDGELLTTDSSTGMSYVHESGRVMVPVRVVAEKLNCDVQWLDYVVLVNEKPEETTTLNTDNRDSNVADVTDRNQGTNNDRNSSVQNNTVVHPNDVADVSQYFDLTIFGDNIATADELNAYLKYKEPEVRKMMEERYPELGFTPYPENIAELYIEIGDKYGIRGDLAFAQALKETGYFQFYGIVKPFQNNFCGLGATGVENTGEELLNGVDPNRAVYIPGVHGIAFGSVADGVEAHIQHLYAYASAEDLPDGYELVDPRFKYVKRGIAPLWTGLNGRWAVPGNGYGESIIEDYWWPALQLGK